MARCSKELLAVLRPRARPRRRAPRPQARERPDHARRPRTVADFGVAEVYNTSGRARHPTAAGMTIGAPAYIGPEQRSTRDRTTDGPYSLSMMAYSSHAAGPVSAARRRTPLAVLYRHITEPVPPVDAPAQRPTRRLAQSVERLLAEPQVDRPAGSAKDSDRARDSTIATSEPCRGARLLSSPHRAGAPARGRPVRRLRRTPPPAQDADARARPHRRARREPARRLAAASRPAPRRCCWLPSPR